MAFRMTKKEYSDYVAEKSPKSKIAGNTLRAFIAGGLICCVGQGLVMLCTAIGFEEENAKLLASVTLVFLGSLFTALHVYDKIAKWAGAGTLVPITGFANSITAPAMEFKCEGMVTGMAANMFVIAGPVLVFGIAASVIYGIILWVF